MPKNHNNLSSRELLARIGLTDDASYDLLSGEPLEDLRGDVGAALRQRYELFNRNYKFVPGDLVTWKPGLKDRRVPAYGQPAVVMEMIAQPILDTDQESGSTYFRQPLDMVLGVIWEYDPNRSEFVTFHFDSRRFQPWSCEE